MNATALNGSTPDGVSNERILSFHVKDPDVLRWLDPASDETEGEELALTGLRIGAHALRHVRGELDVARLRQEGDALAREVRALLEAHSQQGVGGMTTALQAWPDPSTGLLPLRSQRRVANDGELATVLCGLVAGDDSEVARTLVRHAGGHPSAPAQARGRGPAGGPAGVVGRDGCAPRVGPGVSASAAVGAGLLSVAW